MFSNEVANNWPYKWFGFWGSEKEYIGKVYKTEDYVDTTCSSELREKVSFYLDQAPIVLAGQLPKQKCGLCDELLESASFRSDGVWLWTAKLIHYVKYHDFCVPNAMVEHILKHDGVPTQDFDISWEALPWP
jgi:hypothetical protein